MGKMGKDEALAALRVSEKATMPAGARRGARAYRPAGCDLQPLRIARHRLSLPSLTSANGGVMRWSTEREKDWAQKSRYLHERHLQAPSQGPSASPVVPDTPEIKRWKKVIANGNDALFGQYLKWSGLELALLTDQAFSFEEPCSEYANCIATVLESIPKDDSPLLAIYQSRAACLRPRQPIAFEHFMVPFVEHATNQVRHHEAISLLHESAFCDLQRFLLVQLCESALDALILEFSAFRSLHGARSSSDATDITPSTALYEKFIDRMHKERISEFLAEYPVLTRRLAETTLMWIAFINEFFDRLKKDAPELQHLLPGPDLDKITAIQSSLSDRHNYGRVVLGLRFGSGRRLIYKPKDLSSESAYGGLLLWLQQHHAPGKFLALKGLYKEGYGWVVASEPAPCQSIEEVRQFYFSLGALLALFHGIGGNDAHGGNILACGQFPVLIDLETILAPQIAAFIGSDNDSASTIATRRFWDWSVTRTAILPRWTSDNPEQSDLSAGLRDTEEIPSVVLKAIEFHNTDRMAMVERRVKGQKPLNVPEFQGKLVPATGHVDSVVSGFRAMYGFLMANRDAILSPGGPLESFSTLPLRFVFRNTYVYAAVIRKLRRTECLKDGKESSIQASALFKFALHQSEKPPVWPLVVQEVRSLLRGDIPIFNFHSNSEALELEEGERIEQFFAQPAFTQMGLRLRDLSSVDEQLQICYIRSSFRCGFAVEPILNETAAPAGLNAGEGVGRLVQAALEIALRIRESAIKGQDGSVTWVTRGFDPNAQKWKVRPMDARFYDGLTGTALFLAALNKSTGSSEFDDLLIGAVRTVDNVAATARRNVDSGEQLIGAGIGIASIVYGLAKIYELTGARTALDTAIVYANILTPDSVSNDSKYDLMSGAGGCILALLALYRITREARLLELANTCGIRLLDCRTPGNSGLRSWKTLQGKMLAGYSHGAAGIAHALSSLYTATGNALFREAALESCSYENTLYSKQRKNWPNLTAATPDGQPAFWNTWCHGAAGIGLARMACAATLGDLGQTDASEALQSNLLEPLSSVDHVCCGNSGRLELFLSAAVRYGSAVYLEKARQIANLILMRAHSAGQYALSGDSSLSSPSFHQGTAGIGYQLLRLATPAALPCVLTWQ